IVSVFWAFSLLLGSGSMVRSQTLRETGSFGGKVIDINRAAIVAASVKLRADHVELSSVTDHNGAFSFKCAVGEYTLTVAAPGFATVTRKINVTGKTDSIEITLPVGDSTAIVNVVATEAFGYRADLLNTATKTLTSLRDTPQSISVVSKEQIQDQSMASIAEVVSYVSGITAHQGENNRDQLVIRGVSSSAD